MMILGLARNYLQSWDLVKAGGWNIADCAARSYDIEGMHIGTVAAGRIGTAVLRRLKPFDVHLHYTDRHRLPPEVEAELGVTFHKSAADMVPHCDVVTINCPAPSGDRESVRCGDDRADETRRLSGEHGPRKDCGSGRDRRRAGKRSARWICGRRLVPAAGTPRPSLAEHAEPRHDAPYFGHHASAQARYAAGTREILECFLEGRPIREEYLIVEGGHLAGAGAHSYSEGNATGGSEEAERFKAQKPSIPAQ